MCDFGHRRDEKSRPAPWKMSGSSKGWVFQPEDLHHVRPRPLCPRCRLAFSVTAALGQGRQVDYPNRPIKLIVAFPPGGATDVIARVVGQPLGQRLGQQVMVDNRPGSNGNIAAEVAAKAKPDGYTLMLGSDSLFGINPHLYAKMPVDLAKDFVPITNLVANQLILAVNPDERPGQRSQGLRRLRQACQAAAVLCLDRQRQPAPSGDGNAQAAGRSRPPTCPTKAAVRPVSP